MLVGIRLVTQARELERALHGLGDLGGNGPRHHGSQAGRLVTHFLLAAHHRRCDGASELRHRDVERSLERGEPCGRCAPLGFAAAVQRDQVDDRHAHLLEQLRRIEVGEVEVAAEDDVRAGRARFILEQALHGHRARIPEQRNGFGAGALDLGDQRIEQCGVTRIIGCLEEADRDPRCTRACLAVRRAPLLEGFPRRKDAAGLAVRIVEAEVQRRLGIDERQARNARLCERELHQFQLVLRTGVGPVRASLGIPDDALLRVLLRTEQALAHAEHGALARNRSNQVDAVFGIEPRDQGLVHGVEHERVGGGQHFWLHIGECRLG